MDNLIQRFNTKYYLEKATNLLLTYDGKVEILIILDKHKFYKIQEFMFIIERYADTIYKDIKIQTNRSKYELNYIFKNNNLKIISYDAIKNNIDKYFRGRRDDMIILDHDILDHNNPESISDNDLNHHILNGLFMICVDLFINMDELIKINRGCGKK